MSFWAKLIHAAGRHIANYPTIARIFLNAESLKEFTFIGLLDYCSYLHSRKSQPLLPMDVEAVRLATHIHPEHQELLRNWIGH
jgi:hypothetical protein